MGAVGVWGGGVWEGCRGRGGVVDCDCGGGRVGGGECLRDGEVALFEVDEEVGFLEEEAA